MEFSEDISESYSARQLLEALNTINSTSTLERVNKNLSREVLDRLVKEYEDSINEAIEVVNHSLNEILKFNDAKKEEVIKAVVKQMRDKIRYETDFDPLAEKWSVAYENYQKAKENSPEEEHFEIEAFYDLDIEGAIHIMLSKRNEALNKVRLLFNDVVLKEGMDIVTIDLPPITDEDIYRCFDALVEEELVEKDCKRDFKYFMLGLKCDKPIKWLGSQAQLAAFILKIKNSNDKAHNFDRYFWKENVLPNFCDKSANAYPRSLSDSSRENVKYDKVQYAYDELVRSWRQRTAG